MNKRIMMITKNSNLNKIKITRMITSTMMKKMNIIRTKRKMITTQQMKITMVTLKMTQINPNHQTWRDQANLYKSKTQTSLSISVTLKNKILLISVKVIMPVT